MTRQEGRPPEEVLGEKIKINTDAIPDYVRETLAAALVKSVRKFIQQPGGKEYLDRKIAERSVKK